MGIILYRMGPSYLAYTVREMPHTSVTLPLVLLVLLHLWRLRLAGKCERLVKEKARVEKEMREQQ